MRPGNIKLVKNFEELKKNFNDCVENWTSFCLVVEEAEKIGLLVQILEYTSSFLAQINSNAPFSIVDKIHGISAKLFEHFKVINSLPNNIYSVKIRFRVYSLLLLYANRPIINKSDLLIKLKTEIFSFFLIYL